MRRAALGVSCLLVAVGCGHGSSSGTHGTVAFAEQGRLFVSQSDGSGHRQLTDGRHGLDFDPSWAPDGKRVAFLRVPRGGGPRAQERATLWIAQVAGGAPRRVDVPPGVHDPAWSPDGSAIAYSQHGQLWLFDFAAGRSRPLGLAGGCPSWSPDGRALAFCGTGTGSPDDSPLRIARFQPNGPPRVKTLVANGHPQIPGAWSPDGRRIAFTSGAERADVAVIAATGGPSVKVFGGPGVQAVEGWLPDGRLLVADSPPRSDRTEWLLVAPGHDKPESVPALGHAGDPVAWYDGTLTRPVHRPLQSVESDLVKVGDESLFVHCTGEGPTVLLESGLGVPSTTWVAVQRRVESFARVCRYDRPGNGASPPTRGPRDSAADASRLHRLVRALGLQRPIVLVGASFGGLNAQLYGYRYPDDLRGLVLVDAIHPSFDQAIDQILTHEQSATRDRHLDENSEGVFNSDLITSDQQALAMRRRLGIPVVVLRHGRPFKGGRGFPTGAVERLWQRMQQRLAAISPRGRLWVAAKSGHRIAEQQPALVARAIRRVLAEGSASSGHAYQWQQSKARRRKTAVALPIAPP